MDTFTTVVLFAATLDLGLAAGLFATFSYAVMPGLRRADDDTFVAAMRHINVGIINGWFALVFAGALILAVITAFAQPTGWVLAGLAAYVGVLVVTFTINVPLNNSLARESQPMDASAVRGRFERPWVRWNALRTLLSVAAFACFLVASSAN